MIRITHKINTSDDKVIDYILPEIVNDISFTYCCGEFIDVSINGSSVHEFKDKGTDFQVRMDRLELKKLKSYNDYYNETGFLNKCELINFHSRDDYASKTQASFVNRAINDKLIKGMNLFTIPREFFIEKLDSLNLNMYSDSIETDWGIEYD